VEDRTVQRTAQTEPGSGSATDAATEPAKSLPPGAENAGKPGYFTVRPGDSLIRIGLEVGQNWRDLVRWNNLENPNRIEVGQVLRIVPPVAAPAPTPAATVAGTKPTPTGVAAGVTTTAISEPTLTAKPLPASPSTPAAQAGRTGADDVAFIWPASGVVVATFDEQKNKGLGIAGKAGDPVLAAADGRVVYAGSGLRGYGNLIILKHNNTFLTAYAHNQALLVKEDQDVKQGQKIADMGSSDADRVKLHFEVRRQGKPVDPARYLPTR
jgi:lipoprotein NlpD